MRVSRGYRECSSDQVRVTELTISDQPFDTSSSRITFSDTWSPETGIGLVLTLELDLSEVRTHLGLAPSDVLMGGVASYCEATKLRHSSGARVIDTDRSEIRLEIPAFQVDDYIELEAILAVRLGEGVERPPGTPTRELSRVWSRPIRIDLAGSQSRLNIVAEDFDAMKGRTGALWHVELDLPREIDDWLIADFSNVVTVAINKTRRPEIENAVASTLMATDIAAAAIDAIFETFTDTESRTAITSAIWNPSGEAESWLDYLSGVCKTALGPDPGGAAAAWAQGRETGRTKLQAFYATYVFKGAFDD